MLLAQVFSCARVQSVLRLSLYDGELRACERLLFAEWLAAHPGVRMLDIGV